MRTPTDLLHFSGSGQGRRVTGRIRVLVADESQSVRVLVTSLLRDDGRFDVVVQTGSAAETIDRCDDADLVVTDLVLRDTDAFSMLDQLRAMRPQLPVVILAAVDPPYLRNEAKSHGAAGFFTHSADPAELLNGLAALVDQGSVK